MQSWKWVTTPRPPIFDEPNFRHPTGAIHRLLRATRGTRAGGAELNQSGVENWVCRKWGCRGVGALLSVPFRQFIFDKPNFRQST